MITKRFFQVLFLAGMVSISFGNTVLKTASEALTTSSTSKKQMAAVKAKLLHPVAAFVACSGGGAETFTNTGTAQTSYATRTWVGDNGVAWSASDSRNDQTLTGKAIALRSGTLKNTAAVAGGIGVLNFNYKRVFTGNSTLKVFVNGVQITSIVVSSETSTAVSLPVNVTGNVNLEFVNTGNRTVIDDISWDCYGEAATSPQLELANAAGVKVNCGAFGIDFGSHAVATAKDSTFTVKNTGTAPLVVTSVALSGANSTDFTIVSPVGGFTVAPQAATAVVVRFNNTTVGAKAAVLTINQSDVATGCEINLSGTGILECTAPTGTPDVVLSDINPLFATVTVSNSTAGAYLAVLSTTNTLSAIPDNGTVYDNGTAFGGGTVVYNGRATSFPISLLNNGNSPFLHLFYYNSGDCTGGPVYARLATVKSITVPCSGGYETFANIDATTSNTYLTRTWTGDTASWSATDARTDQTSTGKAITLREGTLKNTSPISGIGTLTFNYKRVFIGASVLKILVNGDQYGADINVTSDTVKVYNQAIQISEDAVIELVNSTGRVIIDNLAWTCFEAPAGAKIQLADSNLNQRACGNYTLDFGTAATGTTKERVFNIMNIGSQDLTISGITSNNPAYTITGTLPTVIAAGGAEQVTVTFNAAALPAGVASGALVITSNDVDCGLGLTATVALPCTTPVSGTVTAGNVTFFSTDVTVSGSDAIGYVAIISDAPLNSAPSAANFPYQPGQTVANGVVVYSGTDSGFTINSFLDPSTTYYLSVFPYNTGTDCAGPAFAEAATTTFTTLEILCGGGETFTNTGAPQTNYTTRSWTGENMVSWTATDSRNDQTLNGKAITLRVGSLTNTNAPATEGVATLSFNYKRVFTGNSVLRVYINDVQYGGDVAVTSETPAAFSITPNVTGPVVIKITNSGNRVVIDDLVWTCNAVAGKALTDVTAVNEPMEIKLYPNPNKGQFQLDLGTENADVTVYDLAGKMVYGKKVSGSEMIDLGTVQSGIYIVTIASGNTVSHKKIMVN